MDDHSWRISTVEDMIIKYCHLEFLDVVKRFRKIAMVNNWNRPWDGIDGSDYIKWKNRLGILNLGIDGLSNEEAMEKLEQEDEDAKYEADKEAELQRLRESELTGKPVVDDDKPEYDWEGCDNMSQYENYAYGIFKLKRDGYTGGISNMLKSGMSSLLSSKG
jgi:hypothetical protein